MLSPSLLDIKFILLVCLLGLARSLCPQRYVGLFGALGSALLIGLASPQTLLVISAVVLFYLFPLHRLTKYLQRTGSSQSTLLVVVGLGIAGLVSALVLFKLYKNFTIPGLGGPWLQTEFLSLVGFSYFVFRAIGFLHIQAITRINETSPWTLLYYCLFPPTLTSGPIQKYMDFKQQLESPLPLSGPLVSSAGYRIVRGCFRKLGLAFVLNQVLERLLPGAHTIATSSVTIALLYLYYYFDFAGYSDMAIGYGQLMGVRVPENFRKPFLATNVSEFWRNWHITLVDWFRDHVFIPLGGMQSTRLRAGMIAFLVMVLCGLWHGITLSLLIWGTWHGLMLLGEAVTGVKPMPPSLRHGPTYWTRVLWTNARVAVACVFFLPDPAASMRLLGGLIRW